jgi:hypothetical protein
VAWWNDYDRPDYGRWGARYDSAYWNHPEGRSFGAGAGGAGYGGSGYHAGYPRYGDEYTRRVAPSESPAYGRQADRLLRRSAYDAGYALQPRGGPGTTGGWRGARDLPWSPEEWSGRRGYGWSGGRSGSAGGWSRGYGADYGSYGTGAYSAGAYGGYAGEGYGAGGSGGSRGRYDRGYRW